VRGLLGNSSNEYNKTLGVEISEIISENTKFQFWYCSR